MFGKEPEGSQKGPVLGGEDSLARLKEKLEKIPPKKEEKKPEENKPTGYGKKGYASRAEFRQWAKKQPNTWKIWPGLSEQKRAEVIEKELWGEPSSKYGLFIEQRKREAETRRKELVNKAANAKYPEKKKIEKDIELIDRFLGKK